MKTKTKIIPAINEKTRKKFKKKVSLVSFVDKIHIDIMDGKFVPAKTITTKEINELKKTPKLQIHLMCYNVLDQLKRFKNKNIVEFIFHVETKEEINKIISEVKKRGFKVGIAFNPETIIKNYKKELKRSDIALVMTVNPGLSGQKIIPHCLAKVRQIRKINKNVLIGVDGGVNKENISKVRTVGCSFAAVTNAIFKSKDVKKAIKMLNN